MFIEAILAGIVLGRLRNGSINALDKIEFKNWKVLIGLIVSDLLLSFFIVKSTSNLGNILFEYYPYISTLFYISTILLLGFNLHLKYVRVIQSGYVLNLLPMIANGGKMPVSETALLQIGKMNELELLKSDLLLNHTLIHEGTRFKLFSDIIALPYFLPKVISIGDIVLSLGLVFFISHYMTTGRKA